MSVTRVRVSGGCGSVCVCVCMHIYMSPADCQVGEAASAAATAVGLHAVVEGVGAVIKDLQGDAAEVAELPSSIRLSFNANGEFVLARAACVRTPALQAEWVAADESSEAGDRGSSDEPLGRLSMASLQAGRLVSDCSCCVLVLVLKGALVLTATGAGWVGSRRAGSGVKGHRRGRRTTPSTRRARGRSCRTSSGSRSSCTTTLYDS